MKITVAIALAGSALVSTAAISQTTTYKYDARGRLIEVAHQGGPSNGTTTTYKHDRADNRNNVTVVTGSSLLKTLPNQIK